MIFCITATINLGTWLIPDKVFLDIVGSYSRNIQGFGDGLCLPGFERMYSTYISEASAFPAFNIILYFVSQLARLQIIAKSVS